MNEEILIADVSTKLEELGALVDNDLPKYIVKLIINQHSIEKIKDELSLFLDAVNVPFIEWLEVYLNNMPSQTLTTNADKLEIISASEIEEDILDFEPQDDQLNESKNEDLNELDSSNETNKRKLDDENEECSKKLLNNNKEAVRVNSQNVIKLTDNSHLNDIGLMRRKAMQEKSIPQQSTTAPTDSQKSPNANQSVESRDNDFHDLRDILNLRKKQNREEEQMETADDETKTDDEEKKERCKFWPFCKKESECIYAHPTEQCKQFPSCKLGADKCLYIHPLCKFDPLCTKKDCPFLHIAKKQQIILPPTGQSHMHVECKFYPNCYNNNCPFIHPKLCMYGSMCKNSTCTFKHLETTLSNVAKPHQLKWTKSSNSNSNETSTATGNETNNQVIIKNENLDDQLIDSKDEHDSVLNEIDEAELMQGI